MSRNRLRDGGALHLEAFVRCKKIEGERFRAQVTTCELDTGLSVL